MENNVEILEIPVLVDRKSEAIKALQKLIKRAHKAGNTDIRYEIGEETTVKRSYETEDQEGNRVMKTAMVPVLMFRVFGEAPKYADYVFAGKVEFLDDKNQLLHKIPGTEIELAPRFLKTDCFCDHCKVKRTRADVFIVHNVKTGEQKQVGRQCLRDFLGIDNPEKITRRFSFWAEVKEFSEGRDRGPAYWSLQEILELGAADCRIRGFVSKAYSSEKNPPTMFRIENTIWPGKEQKDKEFADMMKAQVTAEDKAVVEESKKYFASLDPKGNEYLTNCKVLLTYDVLLKHKHLGLVVSAIAAYLKHADKLKLLAKEAQKGPSNFVGAPKEKLKDIEVTLEKIVNLGQSSFNRYAETKLMLYSDAAGNKYSWISDNAWSPGVGETVKINATVKAHKEYNGVKQTVLTRVKQAKAK